MSCERSIVIENNIGKTYGVYEIISLEIEGSACRHKLYSIKCLVCGTTHRKQLMSSIVKRSNKCTCGNRKWRNNTLRKIYCGMVDRCRNPNNKNYKYYGAKGIAVCEEWADNHTKFEDWAINNGFVEGLSIDRINSNEGYNPSNCRWVSISYNSRFKSTTSAIEIDGVIKSGREWSESIGHGVNYINTMIRKQGIVYAVNYIKSKIDLKGGL